MGIWANNKIVGNQVPLSFSGCLGENITVNSLKQEFENCATSKNGPPPQQDGATFVEQLNTLHSDLARFRDINGRARFFGATVELNRIPAWLDDQLMSTEPRYVCIDEALKTLVISKLKDIYLKWMPSPDKKFEGYRTATLELFALEDFDEAALQNALALLEEITAVHMQDEVAEGLRPVFEKLDANAWPVNDAELVNDEKVIIAFVAALNRGAELRGPLTLSLSPEGRGEPALAELVRSVANRRADLIEDAIGRAAYEYLPVELLNAQRMSDPGSNAPLLPKDVDEYGTDNAFELFRRAEEAFGQNGNAGLCKALNRLRAADNYNEWLGALGSIADISADAEQGPVAVMQKMRAGYFADFINWVKRSFMARRYEAPPDNGWFVNSLYFVPYAAWNFVKQGWQGADVAAVREAFFILRETDGIVPAGADKTKEFNASTARELNWFANVGMPRWTWLFGENDALKGLENVEFKEEIDASTAINGLKGLTAYAEALNALEGLAGLKRSELLTLATSREGIAPEMTPAEAAAIGDFLRVLSLGSDAEEDMAEADLTLLADAERLALARYTIWTQMCFYVRRLLREAVEMNAGLGADAKVLAVRLRSGKWREDDAYVVIAACQLGGEERALLARVVEAYYLNGRKTLAISDMSIEDAARAMKLLNEVNIVSQEIKRMKALGQAYEFRPRRAKVKVENAVSFDEGNYLDNFYTEDGDIIAQATAFIVEVHDMSKLANVDAGLIVRSMEASGIVDVGRLQGALGAVASGANLDAARVRTGDIDHLATALGKARGIVMMNQLDAVAISTVPMNLEAAMKVTTAFEQAGSKAANGGLQGAVEREKRLFLGKARMWFQEAEAHWDGAGKVTGADKRPLSFYDLPNIFMKAGDYDALLKADELLAELRGRRYADYRTVQETILAKWMIEEYLPYELKEVNSTLPLVGMPVYPYSKIFAKELFDLDGIKSSLTHDPERFKSWVKGETDDLGELLALFNERNRKNDAAIQVAKAGDVDDMNRSMFMASLPLMVVAAEAAGVATRAFLAYQAATYAELAEAGVLAVTSDGAITGTGLSWLARRSLWKVAEVGFNAWSFEAALKVEMLPITGIPGGSQLNGRSLSDRAVTVSERLLDDYYGALVVIGALYVVPGFIGESLVGADMAAGARSLSDGSWMAKNLTVGAPALNIKNVLTGEASLAEAWRAGREFESLKLALTENSRAGLAGVLRWFSTYLVLAESDVLEGLATPHLDGKDLHEREPDLNDIILEKLMTAVNLLGLDLGLAIWH